MPRGKGGRGSAILVAEGNREEVMWLKRGLLEAGVEVPVRFVWDAQELADYLEGKPPFDNREACPMPSLLALNLDLPNGFELLERIRARQELDGLMVVAWNGAGSAGAGDQAYHLGADYCVMERGAAEGRNGVAERIKRAVTASEEARAPGAFDENGRILVPALAGAS